MTTINDEGEETPNFMDTVGTYDDMEKVIKEGPMEICSEFVAACDSCNADVDALVRAIRQPENLSPSFLSKFFASLRKAAKADCTIITAVEDFIRIYGDRPTEVNRCLVKLGVYA